MRIKKEKPLPPGQRHSLATQYEVPTQMHDHSDEYVLELFEQMLVRVCPIMLLVGIAGSSGYWTHFLISTERTSICIKANRYSCTEVNGREKKSQSLAL